MKISVYQTFNGYRVVAGEHRPAMEHKIIQPRVYETAGEAYAKETNDHIRQSILRIDPTASDESTPATRHHVNLKQKIERNQMYGKFVNSARVSDSSSQFAAEHQVSKDHSTINTAPGTFRTKPKKSQP